MAQTKTLHQGNKLNNAYAYCRHIAQNHYENFPIASFFLPKHLRNSITAIYAFARSADDYADEGELTSRYRLEALQNYDDQLAYINAGNTPKNKLFLALADTINRHKLPISLFQDLLIAFKQDVTKNRYANFNEVLNYCSYSANPIGRLLLHLTKQDTLENLEYSDYICTGLQLINFMQDMYVDLMIRDRCYIPSNELEKCDITIDGLKLKDPLLGLNALMLHQLKRACTIYQKGLPLGNQLHGLFGLEIRLIIAGGSQILKKLATRTNHYKRPILTKRDKWQMLLIALSAKRYNLLDELLAINTI